MSQTTGHFKPSHLDSARFGLRVVRGRLDTEPAEPQAVLDELAALNADLAILRVPAGCASLKHAFSRSAVPYLHADTLVYYGRSLVAYEDVGAGPEGLVLGTAKPEDETELAGLAARGFDGYVSHYNANPRLDAALILEGYVEWACSHLRGHQRDRHTFVARLGRSIVGFLTCTESGPDRSVEIILNAVDPSHSGRGVYSSLLGFALRTFAQAGFERIHISTQVWNYAVQRIWCRHGLTLEQAYDTLHFNLTQSAADGERM